MVPFTVSGLTSVINQVLPEPHAGLLAGLLFGSKASISRDFYESLVASGTLHIIALSGMNISIMEGLMGKLLLPIVGKVKATVLTLMMILWFVWFVGPTSSIVRAAMMGSMSLIAIVYGRQYWALLSWVITCGIMLIIHSSWARDISFQLSAGATLGIILFGTHKEIFPANGETNPSSILAAWGKNFLRIARENIHLTLAAQVFTIPVTMLYFHRISLVSPLTNLAIGWAITPITWLGWMTVLTGWCVLYVGQRIGWIDWILLEYLIRTIYFFGHLPLVSFGW